jgi:hypothetical protein
VLIVGGRYGSPASSKGDKIGQDFYSRYESITKKEYEAAIRKDLPIYILIEKSVYGEYDTFKNNKQNTEVKYAHVDSVNIFHLIELILNQPRNNPVHAFEKYQDIHEWLQSWPGLFKEMINRRSEQNQIASLSKQVNDLAEINKTLKRYLEEVVSQVSAKKAATIIRQEEKRLKEQQMISSFLATPPVKAMIGVYKLNTEKALEIYRNAKTLDHLIYQLHSVQAISNPEVL